ncbi:MAG TPA: bifunctional phosphoglucose/phosphomannose isomerase, partial [Fimbriimonas sp.]
VTAIDPKGMLKYTDEFPKQCREALALARQVEAPTLSNRPNLVLLTGLGGSAAGGDFVRALFEEQAATPFLVNRDYHLPKYVGLGDVVFCCSYSGNTEETLSAYEDAKKAGAKIICVTSGGKLKEKADEDGNPVIQVPGGQPPRTALGYLLIPVVDMCVRLKVLPEQPFQEAFDALDAGVSAWSVEGTDAQPKEIAQALYGKLGILYGLGSWQGLIANRWRGQINENAKNLCFHNAFPELNHNEILGWVGAGKQGVGKYVVVTLSDGTESEKMKTRYKVTKKLIGSLAEFHEVQARGEALLSKLLTLTFFGDYVSIYLAALNQVDPENIDSINTLKAELAKVD